MEFMNGDFRIKAVLTLFTAIFMKTFDGSIQFG